MDDEGRRGGVGVRRAAAQGQRLALLARALAAGAGREGQTVAGGAAVDRVFQRLEVVRDLLGILERQAGDVEV
ncbi:hypothetical protein, partial [Escherichia coli]|uniref:hypothetical protein n=1 Tax=Escherichia coli TaxID=562 RepID=UPI001BC83DDB